MSLSEKELERKIKKNLKEKREGIFRKRTKREREVEERENRRGY